MLHQAEPGLPFEVGVVEPVEDEGAHDVGPDEEPADVEVDPTAQVEAHALGDVPVGASHLGISVRDVVLVVEEVPQQPAVQVQAEPAKGLPADGQVEQQVILVTGHIHVVWRSVDGEHHPLPSQAHQSSDLDLLPVEEEVPEAHADTASGPVLDGHALGDGAEEALDLESRPRSLALGLDRDLMRVVGGLLGVVHAILEVLDLAREPAVDLQQGGVGLEGPDLHLLAALRIEAQGALGVVVHFGLAEDAVVGFQLVASQVLLGSHDRADELGLVVLQVLGVAVLEGAAALVLDVHHGLFAVVHDEHDLAPVLRPDRGLGARREHVATCTRLLHVESADGEAGHQDGDEISHNVFLRLVPALLSLSGCMLGLNPGVVKKLWSFFVFVYGCSFVFCVFQPV